MLPYIDLKRMRYVVAVARTEGITSAAEVLGVTQSALSRSLAEVEESLGIQLFERLARGAKLTPAGERFVSGAKRILAEVDALCAETKDAACAVTGPFRLGIAPRGFVLHASKALEAFAAEYPSVRLEVTTGSAEALCPRLLNGELDLIVGSSNYLRRWPDIRLRSLVKFQFGVLVRRGHPLTHPGRNVREEDVLRYPVILYETIEALHADIAARYDEHGLPPFQPHYVIDDGVTIGRVLLATDAICPMNSRDFSEVSDQLEVVKGILHVPATSFAMANSIQRPMTAAAKRFAALLAAAVQGESVQSDV